MSIAAGGVGLNRGRKTASVGGWMMLGLGCRRRGLSLSVRLRMIDQENHLTNDFHAITIRESYYASNCKNTTIAFCIRKSSHLSLEVQ
jgi:hypothetical protein